MTDLDEQKPSRRLWVFAAVAALAIHLGGVALAIAHLQTDEADDGSARRRSRSDSIWPRRIARRPTFRPGRTPTHPPPRPRLPSRRRVKETDLPKDTPTETDEPDRIVTRDRVEKAEGRRSEDRSGADARPRQNRWPPKRPRCRVRKAPEGQRSVAPQHGTGESARRVRATWQKELVAHLDKHKRYPPERSQKNAEIRSLRARSPRPRVGQHREGFGRSAFDEAALAMVRRSDPVPPPPPLVADEGLSFTLPVVFRVKGKSEASR